MCGRDELSTMKRKVCFQQGREEGKQALTRHNVGRSLILSPISIPFARTSTYVYDMEPLSTSRELDIMQGAEVKTSNFWWNERHSRPQAANLSVSLGVNVRAPTPHTDRAAVEYARARDDVNGKAIL
jgi:hypothetical protein